MLPPKTFLFSLALFLCFRSLSQPAGASLVIGTKDSLYSVVLKEKRTFWVYLPPSYKAADSSLRFPVLYLLDGEAHFHSVTGLVHQLAGGVNGNTLFPEFIVVGIPNTDRTRDLTPVADPFGPDGKPVAFLKTSGGGEAFAAFLEKELIPYVEKTRYTAPHRLLVGHSFGGLTVLNMLVNHTALFTSYIAIDPSMWWAKSAVLKATEKGLAQKRFDGKSLYLAIANTLPAGMPLNLVDKDTTGATEHIRSIRKLAALLDKAKGNGLRSAWRYFADDDHSSVPLIAEYYGLRFLFDGYRMKEATATAGIDSIRLHYKAVSAMMGYTVLPPEGLVNQLGYLYLQAGEVDKALAHFELNADNYPRSANVYDSLGDAWLAKGDKGKARANFEKAVKLDASLGSGQKLDKLGR